MERFEEFDTYAKGLIALWDDTGKAWHAVGDIGMLPDKRMIAKGFVNVLNWLHDVPEFDGMVKAAQATLTMLEQGGKRSAAGRIGVARRSTS